MAEQRIRYPQGASILQTWLSGVAYAEFMGLTCGTSLIISESKICPEKRWTSWRWRQSSANSSLSRLSLFCGKIQGNSPNSDEGRRLASTFVVEIQSLTSRIP